MARQTRRTRVLSIRSRCRRSPSRRDRARSPKSYLSAKRRHRQHRCAPSDSIPRAATAENQSLEIKPDRGPGGAPLQPVPGVRSARAGCRAVRDSTLVAWYRSLTHLAREGRMSVTIGRRGLLIALGGAAVAWPRLVLAQRAGKAVPRVGALLFGTPETEPNVGAFRRGLRDLGYVEAQNLVIEYRYAEGKPERLRALAAELVAIKPDVIFALGGD